MEIEKEIKFIIKTSKLDNIVEIILKSGFQETFVLNIRDIYPDTDDFNLLKNLKGYRERVVKVISVKNIPSDMPAQKKFVYKKKEKQSMKKN